MQEILAAASPYGLIKEADGLITTVDAVNSALLTGPRQQATRQDRRPHRHAQQGHRRRPGRGRAAGGVPQAAGSA